MNHHEFVLEEVLRAKCPMVFSVHHTGTVFLLDLLQWHSQIDGLREMGELVKPEAPPPLPSQLVHLHLTGRKADSRAELDIGWECLKRVAQSGRVLVPIRDPLLSLISRERRLPGGDHRFIVDGFRALVDLELPRNRFLVVDTPGEATEREKALRRALAALQLHFEPFALRVAREWTPKNKWDSGEDLLRLYEIGDMDGLRNRFPLNFDYLGLWGHKIGPFLRDLGYSSLPWNLGMDS